MKYLYWDLGEQQEDSGVVVHLRGAPANVILLDPVNFDRYRYGLSFHYTGGLRTVTPARLEIPTDGHWYLVVDCCGCRRHVQVMKIEVLPAEGLPTASEADPATSQAGRTLAGAPA